MSDADACLAQVYNLLLSAVSSAASIVPPYDGCGEDVPPGTGTRGDPLHPESSYQIETTHAVSAGGSGREGDISGPGGLAVGEWHLSGPIAGSDAFNNN
jgi:hypothetical protein